MMHHPSQGLWVLRSNNQAGGQRDCHLRQSQRIGLRECDTRYSKRFGGGSTLCRRRDVQAEHLRMPHCADVSKALGTSPIGSSPVESVLQCQSMKPKESNREDFRDETAAATHPADAQLPDETYRLVLVGSRIDNICCLHHACSL